MQKRRPPEPGPAPRAAARPPRFAPRLPPGAASGGPSDARPLGRQPRPEALAGDPEPVGRSPVAAPPRPPRGRPSLEHPSRQRAARAGGVTGGARSDDVVSGIRRALVTAQSKLLEAQRKLQASADALHERLGRK